MGGRWHCLNNLKILQTQPIPQVRIALSRLVISDSDRQRFFGAHHDYQFFAPGNRRINQIALQEHIMLAQDRDNHGRVFGALGFVDGNGVGQDNLIQVGVIIRHFFAIKVDGHLLGLKVNPDDPAEITVKDSLLIIVLNLHDLVVDPKIFTTPG